MIEKLDDKVVVVTGAASGIGEAMARTFVDAGAFVMCADRDPVGLDALVSELGDRSAGHVVDVASPTSVDALADATFTRFGAVDVLCNNAGVTGLHPGPSWELPLETWRWVLDVNLMGIVHGHRSFLPRMIASGHPGHIVNTASMSGLVTFPGGGAYGPSKHAAVALSELLAFELAQREIPIGVSILCPAWVSTRILDDERGRPEHHTVDASDTVPTESRSSLLESMKRTGLQPSVVADLVLTAITHGTMYVLPNVEWTFAVVRRAEQIVGGQTQIVPSPG